MASILEVCEAGCDYIDVGMEPLSWGTGHADLLSVQAMLKDAGYQVPEINMEAYMKVRGMIQEDVYKRQALWRLLRALVLYKRKNVK